VEVAKLQALVLERENDLKLAAQIGETVMEENERMERLMAEMTEDMARRERTEAEAKDEVRKLKSTIEQLRKQNMSLVNNNHSASAASSSASSSASAQPNATSATSPNAIPSVKTPTASSSIHDFLRQELSSTTAAAAAGSGTVSSDQYTGNVDTDMRAFIRRLHAERRSAAVLIGTLKESMARLEEDKGEKERELEKAMESVRVGREREERLERELGEMRERRREEEVDAMNERQRELMTLKRSNEHVVEELEAELKEERSEREVQSRMRHEAENTIADMRQRLEALKREADEQRLLATAAQAQAAAREVEAMEAAKKAKKKAAAKSRTSSTVPAAAATTETTTNTTTATAAVTAASPVPTDTSSTPTPTPPIAVDSAQSSADSALASAAASPHSRLQINLPLESTTTELPILDTTTATTTTTSDPTHLEVRSPSVSVDGQVVSVPPTPSGTASDEEHRQLLKQLHHYVTDVRQQLTSLRVEEEKKTRKLSGVDESGSGGVSEERGSKGSKVEMTDDERQAWLDEEETKRREEDERETELARQKERELKEKLKQKAREKRAKEKEKQAEAERTAQRLAAEQQEQANKRMAEEAAAAANRPPLSIDTTASSRTSRSDSYSAASNSPRSAMSTASTSENVTLSSSTGALPAAVTNAALSVPTAVPSFTVSPSFAVPTSSTFSAIDHFTLTHIQSLLSQMWAIALSLLPSTAMKTAAWYDNHHPACLHCHSRFSLTKRKHHCRLCGGLYCSNCSSHTVSVDKFGYKDVRVCNTCFVMARTVVLCRKAVESGQVEYKEVVRQAELYAEREKERARLEKEKAALALTAAGGVPGAHVQAVQKKEKEVTVVQTPKGTTTLALITPPLSPDAATHTQHTTAGHGDNTTAADPTLSTPTKQPIKKPAPISPALVPFFVGSATASSSPQREAKAADELRAAVEGPADVVVEGEGVGGAPGSGTSASAKKKNERMMRAMEAEKEKQRQAAQQKEQQQLAARLAAASAALPPSHPVASTSKSSLLSSTRRGSGSKAVVIGGVDGGNEVAHAAAGSSKDSTKKVKSLGFSKAIL